MNSLAAKAIGRAEPNTLACHETGPGSDLHVNPLYSSALTRLCATQGDPFLHVDWEAAVFFNFLLAPESLRQVVPPPFEIELHEDAACVSLAAVRMTHFRSCRRFSTGRVFGLIREQRFLNLRAYVRCCGEPGALFLYGWLSRPRLLPLPSVLFGLPYSFASLNYQHGEEIVTGSVAENAGSARFAYRAAVRPGQTYQCCPARSLAEFAMERYSGFFIRREQAHVFRVWHPPWNQVTLEATFDDQTLVTQRFPWFRWASFAGAHLTSKIERVWMGKVHCLSKTWRTDKANHHGPSAFYRMP